MSIYGNGLAVVAMVLTCYIIYAVIREYTGITSWQGILMVIKMRKEERTQLKRIALSTEASLTREKYIKTSSIIKHRIALLQKRSDVPADVLYLYTVAWLSKNLLPPQVAVKYVDKITDLLHLPTMTRSVLLEHLSARVGSDIVNTELPVILRQAVLNTTVPNTSVEQECIVLNIASEFMSTLSVTDIDKTG